MFIITLLIGILHGIILTILLTKIDNMHNIKNESVKNESVKKITCEHDFITLYIFNTMSRSAHVICSKCQTEGIYYRTTGVFEKRDNMFINNMYEDVGQYKNEDLI